MIAHVKDKEVYIVDSMDNYKTFYQGLMQSVVSKLQNRTLASFPKKVTYF